VVYVVLILNFFCLAASAVIFRKRVVDREQNEAKAKNTYTIIALILGVTFSLFGYYVVSSVYIYFGYEIAYGHNEEALLLLFSLIVNILLTITAVIIGRVIIGWKVIQW